MEIRKILRLLLRWWWLLIVSAVIPMVVSAYFVSEQLDLYEAKATIMVGTSLQNPDPDLWQMNLSNTLTAAYAELVRQGPVAEAVIERLGLNTTPGQLAGQVATRIYSGAQLLEILVRDTNPEAAALIANALADELMRRSPASGGSDPEQQEFIRGQLEELQAKIKQISQQIDDLTASLSELTSAADIRASQEQIAALEEAKSTYQTAYATLIESYRAESPNVISLFDPAVVPQWPIPSKAKLIVVVSGAAGSALALAAIFLMEYLDTSLRWEGDGMPSVLDMPVLGAIFQAPGKTALVVGESTNPASDRFHAMRANVFLLRPARPLRTLLLTSPGDVEGKSFVLANLALAFASAGQRVIAVDADMRRPVLHEFFDRPNVTGLADVLSDGETGGERLASIPLQGTDFDNLTLLSAGRPPVDPTALLTSSRLPALLKSLTEQGDVVLVNSPSVLGHPDATLLATLVEGTLLVAGAGLTRLELAQQARDRLLGQRGVNLLGLVVNRIRPRARVEDRRRGKHRPPHAVRSPKKKASNRTWLTLNEAADRLGISQRLAWQWCRSGRLPAVRRGLWRIGPSGWQVDPAGLDHLLEDTLQGRSRRMDTSG